MRMRKRFDRDRNTERKIRLNDESAAKFNIAYRKLPPSLPLSLLRAHEYIRSFVRPRISPTQASQTLAHPESFQAN